MTVFLLQLWTIFVATFVLGALLPLSNPMPWARGFLWVALAVFAVLAMMLAALSGEVGGAMVAGPFLSLLGPVIAALSGLSAGCFTRSRFRTGGPMRGLRAGAVSLIVPLALIGVVELQSRMAEADAAKARDALWSTPVPARFEDTAFDLPLSPRLHLVYTTKYSPGYGASPRRRRGREAIRAALDANEGSLDLTQLVVFEVNPDCGGPSRAFCTGVSHEQLRDWCALVSSDVAQPLCSTGPDDQRFRVHFQSRGVGLTVPDGTCRKERCFTRIRITPDIEAVIGFDAALPDRPRVTTEAALYARRLWIALTQAG